MPGTVLVILDTEVKRPLQTLQPTEGKEIKWSR